MPATKIYTPYGKPDSPSTNALVLECILEQPRFDGKQIRGFLAPQIIATGLSLKELWQNRHSDDIDFRTHIVRNTLLWCAAIL
ncbi:MAG: hypothetical protein LR017_01075 [Candidatus Pacebacteria bacterium]|nr:hypothetical protein [Candidatus Paceibacterota bacterium]